MSFKSLASIGIVSVALLAFVSCSESVVSPVSPMAANNPAGIGSSVSPGDSVHSLLGFWMVYGDPSTGKLETAPLRDVSMHLNVVQFLEVNPCTNCFKILSVETGPDSTYNVTVSFRHPYTSLDLTGFDVRGIAMFKGSHTFPVSGLTMSDRNSGDGEVVNADGFTSLYNPTTSGHDYEGYIKGKQANSSGFNATLNAFKRFVSSKTGNTRNAFWAGDTVSVVYQIKLPVPLVFGYAVDACWNNPTKSPVTNPITDFGMDANCPEAWQITVAEQPIGDGLNPSGGSTKLTMDVYHWQGADDAHPVLVECPELFSGQVTATSTVATDSYTQYQATIQNTNLAPAGTYRCLIGKEANENDSSKSWLSLKAYQVYTVTVGTVIGSIHVTAPNGGESFNIGTSHSITWTSQNVAGNVKIELSKDSGQTWPTIISAGTANNGTFPWTPLYGDIGTNNRIRVSWLADPTVYDISDADFTVTGTVTPGWAKSWGG